MAVSKRKIALIILPLLLLGGLRALAPEQLRAAARISWNALSAARAG